MVNMENIFSRAWGALDRRPLLQNGKKASLLSLIGPDVWAGIIAAIAIFAFIFFRGGKVEVFTSSIILPLVGILIASLFAVVKHVRAKDSPTPLAAEIVNAIRYWGAMVFMVFVYENLRSGIDQSNDKLIDDWLLRVDVALFGIEPTVWLQRWYHPVAVDIMAMVYATYFAVPALVLFFLYLKGRRTEFRVLATSVVITLALGYVGYLLFPASPPRFSIIDQYTSPVVLKGLFFHNTAQEIWDKASTASHFCAFPSLHVGLSSTGMFWGIRFRRLIPGKGWTIGILGVVTLALWFSTLYLRHHWFADIIAGWLVAAVAALGGWVSMKVWSRFNGAHGPSRP